MPKGDELLKKVKDLGDISKTELVKLVDMYQQRKTAVNASKRLHSKYSLKIVKSSYFSTSWYLIVELTNAYLTYCPLSQASLRRSLHH